MNLMDIYIYVYVYIHISPPLHRPLAGKSYVCLKCLFFRNLGDAKPDLLIFKLLLRPWDPSHRVERQKLMVNSQEEAAVFTNQKKAFTSRVQVDNRISTPISYLNFGEQNISRSRFSLHS